MTEQNTVEDLIDVTSEFDISDMELHNGRLVPIVYKTRTSEYGTLDIQTDAVIWMDLRRVVSRRLCEKMEGFKMQREAKGRNGWLQTTSKYLHKNMLKKIRLFHNSNHQTAIIMGLSMLRLRGKGVLVYGSDVYLFVFLLSHCRHIDCSETYLKSLSGYTCSA